MEMKTALRKVWYKLGDYWRRGDNDGDNSPQDRSDGTDDLGWNTCTKCVIEIRKRGHATWEEIDSFNACADLLIAHKRYPDIFRSGIISDSRMWYYFCKYTGIKLNKWRPQHDMTRDPYVALGSLYEHLLGMEDGIYDEELSETFNRVKMVWYVWRPNHTIVWWRRLKKDNREHYIKRIEYFQDLADVAKYERENTNEFWEDI